MPDISSASAMLASRPPFNLDSPPSIAMRGVGAPNDLSQAQRILTSQQHRPAQPLHNAPDLGAVVDLQTGASPSTTTVNDESEVPDGAIIDALKSAKERLFVLRIGEQMEGLIQERSKLSLEVLPSTSYQRMLVHRSAQYYKLSQETDPQTKAIVVGLTLDSRIPSLRMAEIVPVESAPAPAFKIMRRSANDRPVPRKALSNSGEGESDDGQGSEAGSSINSMGLVQKKKQQMTIAEREAAYNEARSRIFLSETPVASAASSSTQSLSSLPVAGDSAASVTSASDEVGPAAPSETFAPKAIQKNGQKRTNVNKERRAEPQKASPKPTFDVDDDPDFNRNAFTYPSLYEPSTSGAPPYDPSQYITVAQAPSQTNENGSMPMPYPPFPPYATYPPPYMPSYPYYPYDPRQFPYPPPQSNDPHNAAVPPTSVPQNGPSYPLYPPSGSWYPPPGQVMPPPPPGTSMHLNTSNSRIGAPVTGSPNPSQYPIYPPGQPYYYPQPQQPGNPLPEAPLQQQLHQPMVTSFAPPRDNGFQTRAQPMSRTSSRSSIQNSPGGTCARLRLGATNIGIGPPPVRAWSYGGGITVPMRGDRRKGPSSSSRTGSVSSRSGSGGAMTPADETGSIASSETSSSSSRKTYTSGSSVHPLPPRPDWAIGLTPPRSHSSHSRNSSSSNSPSVLQSISDFPPLPSGGGIVQSATPLVTSKTSEPTAPHAGTAGVTPISKGVWKSPLTTRSLLLANFQPDANPAQQSSPSPQQLAQQLPHGYDGAVHFGVGVTLPRLTFPPNHPYNQGMPGPNLPQLPINPSTAPRQLMNAHSRLDERDGTFNRPPPKSAELFNPKSGSQHRKTVNIAPSSNSATVPSSTVDLTHYGKVNADYGAAKPNRGPSIPENEDRIRGEAVANAILVDKLADMQIGEAQVGSSINGRMAGSETDNTLIIGSLPSLESSNPDLPKDTISTVTLSSAMAIATSD